MGVPDVEEMTNMHIMSSVYKILAKINLAQIVWQSSEVGRIIKRVVNQETSKWGVHVQNVELARVDVIHGQITIGAALPATLDDWKLNIALKINFVAYSAILNFYIVVCIKNCLFLINTQKSLLIFSLSVV